MIISKILLSEEISLKISELVAMQFDSFDSLMQHDKEKLISLIIKNRGTEAMEGMIVNTDNYYSLLNHFNNFILSGNTNDAFYIAKTMRDNAIEYFRDDFNYLFETHPNRPKHPTQKRRLSNAKRFY